MKRLLLSIILISLFAMPAHPADACKTPATTTAKSESPFFCNRLALSPAIRKRHFEDLGPALIARKTAVREVPNGYELQFPSDSKTLAMLTEWIEQERLCCPFFEIDLRFTPDRGPVWMRLTGGPGTKDFIRAATAWIHK